MTLIQPLQAIKPELDEIASPDVFFGEVKRNYLEFLKAGFFSKMGSESLYVYQIESEGKTKTGLVCRLPVEAYTSGSVVKHENTLAAKEQKMLLLTIERQSMVKPILLTYPSVRAINTKIKAAIEGTAPTYSISFDTENTVHRFYAISDGNAILELRELFRKHVPLTYVADGHHRLATAANLQRRMEKQSMPSDTYNYFFTALFPNTELEILEYNRMVTFDHCSPTMLVAMLSRKMNIKLLETPRKPKDKHEIVMLLNGEWYALKWRSRILKSYQSALDRLDVSLLNEEVLSQIFQVQDISTDKRVGYLEGPLSLEAIGEKLNGRVNTAAFIMPRVTWEEFLEITNAGISLPPKSTWFEPRMKNGVIVYGY